MLTFLIYVCCAALAGALGGAAVGIKIGGEAMGNEMAALMGGFFGLSAVVPASIVAAALQHLR